MQAKKSKKIRQKREGGKSKIDKILELIPPYPRMVQASTVAKKTGYDQSNITEMAKEQGITVYNVKGIPNLIDKPRRYPSVLIYKDQQPYKSVQDIADASRLTKVPYCTIRRMIINPVLSDKDKKNGGRTTPNGWGFDYLA